MLLPILFAAATAISQTMTPQHLPVGLAPPPVSAAYFPDRLHAFVWRNWTLVPLDQMAKTVSATPDQIRKIGRSMGLREPPAITEDVQRRSYLTVIRRNWHLLPYDQLLTLLDWTPEEMAFTLREDDFLYIKLGSLKPKCDPLKYIEPDERVKAREKEIAATVHEMFGDRAGLSVDPLFSFVKRLSAPPAPAQTNSQLSALNSQLSPRYCYSYFALYGDPLLDNHADPYPDGYLARMAQAGADGVWLQALLYKLAPFPWDPAKSEHYEQRLANLRVLVARAKKHGVGVYLYLNEPRAMPASFFRAHPELRGVTEGDYSTICTSVPAVQDYIRRSVASICRAVPDLAGFFTITASENLTNCWSHGNGATCPRCSKQSPADVIAEVNRLVQEGIHDAGTKTRLIAWDWGWGHDWALDAIRLLPPEAALQSVSEWSLPIERGGVKSEVGEYSVSSIGPGPRATRHWAAARERGLKTIAKIQANNSWEISTVPYIPALENVARHALNLRQAHVDGLMLGWTLGGYPSPNLEAVAKSSQFDAVDPLLQAVAERRVGKGLAPTLVTAWTQISAAFREYPYHVAIAYHSPVQLGPANSVWAEPTGYTGTMVGFPYDDLDLWRGPYPPDVFIRQWQKMADGFDAAIAEARRASRGSKASNDQRSLFDEDLEMAEACAIHFRSVANQARYILARGKSDPASLQECERALTSEIDLANRLYALQTRDSRLGFEASNQYAYVPIDLVEKVINCRYLLRRATESH